MIELKELTLGYGQRTLLKTVNARITGGQLAALLGRNGTGTVSYTHLDVYKRQVVIPSISSNTG